MVVIGRTNTLRIKRIDEVGARLDGGRLGDILLPQRYLSSGAVAGAEVEVFLYRDSEDRLIATTEKPLAEVGQCAWLRVVSVSTVGAFLDWGLPKDLLVPFAEQPRRMEAGRHYLVRIFVDNTHRIAASARLDRFLLDEAEGLEQGQEVSLIIADSTDLGVKAVVNHRFWGLLYHDTLFRPVRKGQSMAGFIKRVREDGKLELTLERPGYDKVGGVADTIMDKLRRADGFLPLNDKSPPDLIAAEFQVSKGVFKQAIGALYKQRLIKIEKGGIRLT
ncbi:CvfB family protein [Hydrocarboniclastica marina]|uniref:GntR family transcriptional regulator n=1 Tax=Hydrocarboniclastica marina TaxID=2259620 RepID=A0A4P7XDE9_9ALTE|nr:S1-like domain-containing RNA-binding protein [Hydrocarboniclastica marina]MAL98726.1 GntR family transcriptional regulator [Alteromonadaceae bacterium]QCF24615.1 GntR family transcriptional regulator [Hydrocarboniclastica marina]|tara:strand:+ start:1714 stop:2541 length:828 start_codon:yes stop_codon:yes gene_type:complete